MQIRFFILLIFSYSINISCVYKDIENCIADEITLNDIQEEYKIASWIFYLQHLNSPCLGGPYGEPVDDKTYMHEYKLTIKKIIIKNDTVVFKINAKKKNKVCSVCMSETQIPSGVLEEIAISNKSKKIIYTKESGLIYTADWWKNKSSINRRKNILFNNSNIQQNYHPCLLQLIDNSSHLLNEL